MAVYATVDDVENRWDDSFITDATSVSKVQILLDEAHHDLYLRVPDIDTRVAGGDSTALGARIALVQAVLRVLNNPKGIQGERVGDLGYYYGAGSRGNTRGRVVLLPEDLELLGFRQPSPVSSFRPKLPGHALPITYRGLP